MSRKPLPAGAVIDPALLQSINIHGNEPKTLSRKTQQPPPYDFVDVAFRDGKGKTIDQKYNPVNTSFLNNTKTTQDASDFRHTSFSGSDKQGDRHDVLHGATTGSNTFPALTDAENTQDQPKGNRYVAAPATSDPMIVARAGSPKITNKVVDVLQAPEEKSSKLVKGLAEASLFLGGLLKHPVESTKHFSILRHSHGLVYYKGSSTSVAFTVFSDTTLPSDRRYWLQLKGWTGNTGMNVKALFRTNSSWTNVTPARQAEPEDLPPLDERAWQRDIRKFLSKPSKSTKDHTVRETIVIRIPGEAVDGYFRVVMTTGASKSVLCPGPVFRVASTSISASSIKGASLLTLPVELGLHILQLAATQVAATAVAPYTAVAQQGAAQVVPQTVRDYAPTAYSLSGAQGFVETVNDQYETRKLEIAEEARTTSENYTPLDRPDVAGNTEGPAHPFPITVSSIIVRGTGMGLQETGMPTANLQRVAVDKIMSLSGLYFGWAFITPKDRSDLQESLHSDWRHAVITVDYTDAEKASVAAQKTVRAYLLHNYDGYDFFDAKIELYIMGFLRPIIDPSCKEAFFIETLKDIEITRNSLEREHWGPEAVLKQNKKTNSDKSFLEHCTDARMVTQRHLDRIPMHRLGIRTDNAAFNERGLHGNGGLYIIRDGR